MKITQILVALFVAGAMAAITAQQTAAPVVGDAGAILAVDPNTALPNSNRNRSGNKTVSYGVFEDEGQFFHNRQIRKKMVGPSACQFELCTICRLKDGHLNAATGEVNGVKGTEGGWTWDCRTGAGNNIADSVTKTPAGSDSMVCASMVHSINDPVLACLYNETTLEQAG